jgi:hypothetical protein
LASNNKYQTRYQKQANVSERTWNNHWFHLKCVDGAIVLSKWNCGRNNSCNSYVPHKFDGRIFHSPCSRFTKVMNRYLQIHFRSQPQSRDRSNQIALQRFLYNTQKFRSITPIYIRSTLFNVIGNFHEKLHLFQLHSQSYLPIHVVKHWFEQIQDQTIPSQS